MADLAHAKDNDTDLIGDPSAVHWAERFVCRVRANLDMAQDEAAMATWFAGAIETGRDSCTRPHPGGDW